MSGDKNTILVHTVDDIVLHRGDIPVPTSRLKVKVLAESVNLFLTQIEEVLEKAPDEVGKFKFTEFTISAEVSADGKLILAGTGVEAGMKGGFMFKFEKK